LILIFCLLTFISCFLLKFPHAFCPHPKSQWIEGKIYGKPWCLISIRRIIKAHLWIIVYHSVIMLYYRIIHIYIYSYRISCYFWYYIIILFCFTKKLSIYYYFYLCILWCYLHFPVTCPLNSGHLWIGFTWRPCVLGMAGDLPLRRSGLLTVQKNGFDHETCGFHLIEIHIYIYVYIYTYIYIYQIFTIHFGFDNEQCGFHNDFIWSNLW
jgi:hypothetical protein